MALPTLILQGRNGRPFPQLFSRNTRPRHSNRGAAAGAGAAARALRLRREQTPSTEMLSCGSLPVGVAPRARSSFLAASPQQPTDAPTTTAPLLSTARLLLSWTRYSIPLRANVVTHTTADVAGTAQTDPQTGHSPHRTRGSAASSRWTALEVGPRSCVLRACTSCSLFRAHRNVHVWSTMTRRQTTRCM